MRDLEQLGGSAASMTAMTTSKRLGVGVFGQEDGWAPAVIQSYAWSYPPFATVDAESMTWQPFPPPQVVLRKGCTSFWKLTVAGRLQPLPPLPLLPAAPEPPPEPAAEPPLPPLPPPTPSDPALPPPTPPPPPPLPPLAEPPDPRSPFEPAKPPAAVAAVSAAVTPDR